MEVMPMFPGRNLPVFSVRESDFPDIYAWEVNSSHYLVLKVKVIAKRARADLNMKEDRQKLEADFQVLSMKSLTDEPVDAKTLEKKDFERLVAKAKSENR